MDWVKVLGKAALRKLAKSEVPLAGVLSHSSLVRISATSLKMMLQEVVYKGRGKFVGCL